MSSPSRRHFARAVAAKEAAAAGADPMSRADATNYQLQLLQLAEHRRRLKGVMSMEGKAALKRQILPEYADYVAGVLSAGTGAQDDVLMTVMAWRIDVADFAGALAIAEYAIRYGLAMPDQYQRTAANWIAEEFADMALRAHAAGGLIDHASLIRADELTADKDMPDEVRARLRKAIGLGLAADALPDDVALREQALQYLRRALELHDKVGVKKDIERLERELKNLAGAAGAS
ncbi:phage terminase small subunit [Chitinolyticbacter meiyuanensis]|uniref:phage terminase small subunit n=1 Tax=Chitinolyticbacter meiyuanensis TaxID=682798 RepID=UPI0011E5E70C|nr:phage terminase small subunit [Chitinolyticbacter meiyuanensis]